MRKGSAAVEDPRRGAARQPPRSRGSIFRASCRVHQFRSIQGLTMGGKGGKSKRSKSKGSKKKTKKPVSEVDILSPAAMLNAYYISHNAAACLEFRGFSWPGSPKKKGKKGK
ncbi:small lysine-rich protein 1 isoform X2 [Emydura macquarii macquarii]|uniref:small lysine-rich protein 1 isoform X2 n=1 Tax=Emydura macquarii macquarii TaxID=1129001 RepID=UPI00352A636E